MADEDENELEPEGTIRIATDPPPPPAPTTNGNAETFTKEEVAAMLEKARKQEKDKLYEKLGEQDKTLAELQADLAKRQAAEAAAEKAAEDERKARERDELTAKELLEQKDQEWSQRFAQLQQEREQDRMILKREAEFQALAATRESMLGSAIEGDSSGRTVRDTIAPQLLDYVGGNSEAEIAQSIAMAQRKTADILAEVSQAQQRRQQQAKGASVTAPAVGPMETDQAYETLTPADIQNMSMDEYRKNREKLLAAASRARQGA